MKKLKKVLDLYSNLVLYLGINKLLNMRFLMYGAVAQLGEHLVCTEKVAGSIPVSSTKRVVSQ